MSSFQTSPRGFRPQLTRLGLAVFGLGLALLVFSPAVRAAAVGEEPQDAGRVVGNPKAPITVVEYASMTCPHCAEFSTKVMPKFKAEWVDTGKAKWIFRDYPLDGAALKAAVVIRCAPADRFYNFVAAFFTNQANWARASDPTVSLTRLAKLGGLGEERIKACFSSKKLEDAVLQQQLDGKNRFGVNSTPTIYINGNQSKGFSRWEEFEAELKSAAK
ncbi:MAG: DsbA family protein [Alphaproteobacteria bacterium]|nr:DsbA family protein [Alphaproteobacteria bacterium]